MNGRIIALDRGQLVFGIRSCSRDTKITPRQIRTRLDLMKTYGFLTHQATHSHSIITICNYDQYQSYEDEERHTNDTPTTTYKNEKNVKNKRYTPENEISGEVKTFHQDAEDILSQYPKISARDTTIRSIVRLLKKGETKESLSRAVSNYNSQIKKEGTEKKYILQSNNFFGQQSRYKDYLSSSLESKKLSPIDIAIQRCKDKGDF